jgi:hypothetical protein
VIQDLRAGRGRGHAMATPTSATPTERTASSSALHFYIFALTQQHFALTQFVVALTRFYLFNAFYKNLRALLSQHSQQHHNQSCSNRTIQQPLSPQLQQ